MSRFRVPSTFIYLVFFLTPSVKLKTPQPVLKTWNNAEFVIKQKLRCDNVKPIYMRSKDK